MIYNFIIYTTPTRIFNYYIQFNSGVYQNKKRGGLKSQLVKYHILFINICAIYLVGLF